MEVCGANWWGSWQPGLESVGWIHLCLPSNAKKVVEHCGERASTAEGKKALSELKLFTSDWSVLGA